MCKLKESVLICVLLFTLQLWGAEYNENDYVSTSIIKGISAIDGGIVNLKHCIIKIIPYNDSIKICYSYEIENETDKSLSILLGVPQLRSFIDLSKEQLINSKNNIFNVQINNNEIPNISLSLSRQYIQLIYLEQLSNMKMELEWDSYNLYKDSLYAYYGVDSLYVFDYGWKTWKENNNPIFPSELIKLRIDSLLKQRNALRIEKSNNQLQEWLSYRNLYEELEFPIFSFWQYFEAHEKKKMEFRYKLPSGKNLSSMDQSYRYIKVVFDDFKNYNCDNAKIEVIIDVNNIDSTTIDNILPYDMRHTDENEFRLIKQNINNEFNDFIYLRYRCR